MNVTRNTLRTIYAVSELAETLRAVVEDALPRVWVEGEVSNLSRPASGHWYFTLKDERAQIRCAMFRNANRLVRPPPQNGDRVLVRASAGYYVARGDLQLICEHMEPAGEGALLRAFEDLKRKLAAEGLFETDRKQAIPSVPRKIGLITSATGAAVQDVLTAISRRFPLLEVVLWPVPVQGDASAPAIVQALEELPVREAPDVILLVRGGGSLEDLWSFNEENVARAIAACPLPVVTGVGHETDTTIADLVADLRAATPTAAAELVTPNQQDFVRLIHQSTISLRRGIDSAMSTRRLALDALDRRQRQQHPRRLIQDRAQRLDDCSARLSQLQRRLHKDASLAVQSLCQRLWVQAPAAQLTRQRQTLDQWMRRLRSSADACLLQSGKRLERSEQVLRALNPKAVLQRGYSIAQLDSGEVLLRPAQLGEDAAFDLILAEGRLRATRTR